MNGTAAGRTGSLVILCYHRVLPASERLGKGRPYFVRGTAVREETFQAHVSCLRSHFDVVGEDDVLAWLTGSRSFVRPACWITFDDGYWVRRVARG